MTAVRLAAVILLPFVLLVVACTDGAGATTNPTASVAPTGAPPSAAAASPGAPASSSPGPVASAGGSGVGQTTTDWGRIWDALPPGFPAFPGAQPTQTGSGPATAVLELPGRFDSAVDWWKEALEAAGYRLEAVNGPLEDGSIVIDVVGSGACRAQVAIAPLGDRSVATIFLGTDCPFQ